MVEALQRALTLLGMWAARPAALLVIPAFAILWLIFQRETFNFRSVATLVVWLMAMLIQRSVHRDTQAIHAKLDELLRAIDAASSELAKIDSEEPEAIEQKRAEAQESN
jgi:low affinity Fe/Cu permease